MRITNTPYFGPRPCRGDSVLTEDLGVPRALLEAAGDAVNGGRGEMRRRTSLTSLTSFAGKRIPPRRQGIVRAATNSQRPAFAKSGPGWWERASEWRGNTELGWERWG